MKLIIVQAVCRCVAGPGNAKSARSSNPAVPLLSIFDFSIYDPQSGEDPDVSHLPLTYSLTLTVNVTTKVASDLSARPF